MPVHDSISSPMYQICPALTVLGTALRGVLVILTLIGYCESVNRERSTIIMLWPVY